MTSNYAPRGYRGVRAADPANLVYNPRDPNVNDYLNFVVGDEWQNTVTTVWWKLCSVAGGIAVWEEMAGPGTKINTITTEDGTIVVPDTNDNVNLYGDVATGTNTTGSGSTATVHNILSTTPQAIAGTSTNTILVPATLNAKLGTQTSHGMPFGLGSNQVIGWTGAATNGQLLIGGTGVVPALGNLTSTDGSIVITNGTNTIDLSTTGTGKNEVQQLTTDDGVHVLPDTNGNINLAGNSAQGVNTTGNVGTFTATVNVTHANSAQTIAGSATNLVVDPAGLNAKLGVQTQYGIPVGEGPTNNFQYTNALQNGQLVIGATGNQPAAANITSADGSVTITNGANTIDLSATGGEPKWYGPYSVTAPGNTRVAFGPVFTLALNTAFNVNVLMYGTDTNNPVQNFTVGNYFRTIIYNNANPAYWPGGNFDATTKKNANHPDVGAGLAAPGFSGGSLQMEVFCPYFNTVWVVYFQLWQTTFP